MSCDQVTCLHTPCLLRSSAWQSVFLEVVDRRCFFLRVIGLVHLVPLFQLTAPRLQVAFCYWVVWTCTYRSVRHDLFVEFEDPPIFKWSEDRFSCLDVGSSVVKYFFICQTTTTLIIDQHLDNHQVVVETRLCCGTSNWFSLIRSSRCDVTKVLQRYLYLVTRYRRPIEFACTWRTHIRSKCFLVPGYFPLCKSFTQFVIGIHRRMIHLSKLSSKVGTLESASDSRARNNNGFRFDSCGLVMLSSVFVIGKP